MAPGALLVVGALALLHSALGLGVARLAPSTDAEGQLIGSGSAHAADGQLTAGDGGADEEDDQSTLLGQRRPGRKPIYDEIGREVNDVDASRYLTVTEEETSARDAAKLQCPMWNETGQPGVENGTITYLVTRMEDLDQLGESLPRLRYYFLEYWPYPIKIFIVTDSLRGYDNDTYNNITCPKDRFNETTSTWRRPAQYLGRNCRGSAAPNREEVSKVASASLGENYDFEILTFDLRIPEAVKTDRTWEACKREHFDCGPRFAGMNKCAAAVSTGYKHMNQFFTKVMYENEGLSKYRYYLRLDADFEFRGRISRDPFCLMAKTGRKFVWQTRRRNGNINCTEGLWEWFLKYQQDNSLTPADLKLWRPTGVNVNYVGYAGMGDLDFFRSERVRKLADAFNNDGRVYLNRWSDQTYYVLLFALFENHSAVGDLGFSWPQDAWCHKCRKEGKFDPRTGELTPEWEYIKRKPNHPRSLEWKLHHKWITEEEYEAARHAGGRT